MTEFSRKNRVIYVEPVTDFISVIFRRSRWYKLKFCTKISDNIAVVSPITLVVSKGNQLIRCMNQFLQRFYLKFFYIEWTNTILWSYDPSSYKYFKRYQPMLKLYFIADEYTIHKGSYLPYIAREEGKTLDSADLTFAVTEKLQASKQKPESPIYLSHNAVNTSLFDIDLDYPTPPEFTNIERPLIGVVGAVRDWVDVDLIIETAHKNPDLVFTSVGPGWPFGKQVPENLLIIGQRPYDKIPAYINSMTVGLIPFKVTEYTRSTNPLKLYEYLALGKPVVVTDMLGYDSFADVVFISKNSDQFSENINRALADAVRIRSRAISIARENSWESRAEVIANKIVEII
tara:strand:+ start:2483 stop:3517 length:1035 start_codon:yes stop_codon:yes gene_type:complete